MFQAAIHQPDFIPWLGFFDKLCKAEEWIIFDNVPISSGKSWSSRVKILNQNKEQWLTIAILKKGRGGQKLFEVEIQDFKIQWRKIIKTLTLSYKKHPFGEEVCDFFSSTQNVEFTNLSDFNIWLIEQIWFRIFNSKLNVVRCSDIPDLKSCELKQTEMIVEVCKKLEIKNYLSGDGCLDFLDTELFKKNRIDITIRNYDHPTYDQKSSNFIPGLSVVDAIANIGFEGVKRLLLNKELVK